MFTYQSVCQSLFMYQSVSNQCISIRIHSPARAFFSSREMLDFGFQQLDIANEMDSPMLRAEAYLTLARGNERLGNLEKAVSYCRHSLYNQCDQSRTTGYVHLTLGNTYLVYSSFSKAIEHYELALKVSRSIHDTALELQVYCGLGHTFCLLQDFEKSLSFSAKAFELSKSFHISDLNSKFQRLSLVTLATPLRKLGRLHEAKECCQVGSWGCV